MKNIATQKITLPGTGFIIEFNEFLTTGEVRKLQRTMFTSDVSLEVSSSIDPKKANAVFNMQDLALGFIFAGAYQIIDGQEKQITVEDPIAWVGELPPVDGNFVYNTVTSIMNASMMTEDAKKN